MKAHQGRYSGKYWNSLFLAASLAVGCLCPSYAADFAYGVGYAGAYDSNISRLPDGARSEWINSVYGGFAYVESTPSVVARAVTNATYRDFSRNIYNDDTVFDARANAIWTLSPRRLTWSVDEAYVQLLENATSADTPANRANTNTFSTGPDFTMRFSPVNSMILGARAGDFRTSNQEIDNSRLSGSVSWEYQSSAITTYSFNYAALRIDYDNDLLNTSFSRQDIFLRTVVRPSRSQYVLDVGKAEMNPVRGEGSDNSLARLTWLRQMTPESSLSVLLGKEVTDIGSEILVSSGMSTAYVAGADGGIQVSAAPPSPVQNTVTSDVYVTKRAEMNYNHRGSQFGASVILFARSIDYERAAFDRREKGGRVQFSYTYFGTSTVSLFSDRIGTEYLNLVREDVDTDSGLRFAYLSGKNVTFGIEAHHIVRSSTTPMVGYTENRALFTIAYTSGPAYAPALGR